MKQATRPIELLRTPAYVASSGRLLWFLVNSAQATHLSRYFGPAATSIFCCGRIRLAGSREFPSLRGSGLVLPALRWEV